MDRFMRAVVLGVTLAGALAWAGTAAAQSLSITVVSVSDFSPVSLNGTTLATTATVDDFQVADTRGAPDGWNVTVQATQFLEWDGAAYVPGGESLPTGSLVMPAPSVSGPAPDPSITAGPYAIDGASVKIASAPLGEGLGTYSFTQGGPLTLSVPASAHARTYRSDITISIASGP